MDSFVLVSGSLPCARPWKRSSAVPSSMPDLWCGDRQTAGGPQVLGPCWVPCHLQSCYGVGPPSWAFQSATAGTGFSSMNWAPACTPLQGLGSHCPLARVFSQIVSWDLGGCAGASLGAGLPWSLTQESRSPWGGSGRSPHPPTQHLCFFLQAVGVLFSFAEWKLSQFQTLSSRVVLG